MIKSDLIEKLSADFTHYPEKKVAGAVNDLIDAIRESLITGERIEIRGFGSFTLRHRKPRKARNPKTGESLQTEDKYNPHFKAGKKLKLRVDQQAGRSQE